MESSDIQEGLREFVEPLTSQTYLNTFRVQKRGSLLGADMGTRANSIWKMAEYIVAPYDGNDDITLDQYIKGWTGLVKNYKNQYLFIEISQDEWQMYDSTPKLLGGNDYIIEFLKEKKRNAKLKLCDIMDKMSLQQIYYGAPGTGKSYEINERTKGCSVIRTTFHPDSDYSTFVGAYKPTMGKGKVYGAQGPVRDEQNNVIEEERITYTFIKQAFLKAYLSAWKKYTQNDESSADPQFLVIEEINRGNCAQIFGDLFQLLDRSDNGFSTYPIEADADLQKEIKKAFSEENEFKLSQDIAVDSAVKNYTSNSGKTLSDDIQNGRILLLPPNLCIWATMNTSDQSLFPIDSAFKRRWEWRYIKIANGYKKDDNGIFLRDSEGKRVPLGWTIRCGETNTDWWKFIQAINNHIGEATSSDDKKLGYFFCKPKKGEDFIGEEAFVGKVIFYLWNDVFKDNDTSLFKLDNSSREPSFDEFYTEDEDGNTIANNEAISKFIENVFSKEDKIQDDSNE